MSQKLPINGFKLFEETSQFSKGFIEAIMKKVAKDIFFKLMFSILKSYVSFITICYFNQKE